MESFFPVLEKKMKKLLPWLMLLAGICIFAYPFLSNWSYEHGVGGLVEAYQETTDELNNEEYDDIISAAREYNESLNTSKITLNDPFISSGKEDVEYDSLLGLDENGIMCYVEIPSIDVYLPVFHGTSQKVLQKGAGHLEGTSLPIGGESTHCVISAHTGLRSAKMFTDLDQLEKGDIFYIHTLNETLAYKVDRILTVLPEETEYLQIEDGKDEVTLMTCTPYGVNSHRLLVRGHRVDYEETKSEASVEHTGSTWMKEYLYAILFGATSLVLIFIISKIRRKPNEVA